MRELPPLNAVRTFEVAARHDSFTSAARELHVTHGAVSRAMGTLEEWIGVRLFSRTGRSVALTDAGRRYLEVVGPALAQLAAGTSLLRERVGEKRLRVVAPPTLTVRWLIPRLPHFYQRHPEVAVRVRTAEDNALEQSAGFDVAIRRGPGPWPGLRGHGFLGEDATPVAAPSLLRRAPLRTPADLARHTLIHAEARADAWPAWLRAFAPKRLQPAGELRFDHFYLALQAAVDGLGLAMGPRPVISEDLAARRLVIPFPQQVISTRRYFAITHGRLGSCAPQVQAFVSWLVEEGNR